MQGAKCEMLPDSYLVRPRSRCARFTFRRATRACTVGLAYSALDLHSPPSWSAYVPRNVPRASSVRHPTARERLARAPDCTRDSLTTRRLRAVFS